MQDKRKTNINQNLLVKFGKYLHFIIKFKEHRYIPPFSSRLPLENQPLFPYAHFQNVYIKEKSVYQMIDALGVLVIIFYRL